MNKDKIDYYNKLANSGELYDSYDEELLRYQRYLVNRLREFNLTPETDEGLIQRQDILKEIVGTYNEGLFILPPIYANFGLNHVHFGKNVFINFNVTIVDDAEIHIGDNTMIGPGVNLSTAIHPFSPTLRKHGLQYNKPIYIGENVWIGSGAIILPGVKIGNNSIIGAGSVVTKDIPENVVAVGNPARILRELTEEDYKHYDGKLIPEELFKKYK